MEHLDKKNLLTIGRFVEKLDYKTNIQDYTTWKSMGEYFDNIYIIVQSPDSINHTEEIGNLHIYWIADKGNTLISRLYFLKKSYKVSKDLVNKCLVDVINIGEPVVAGYVGLKLKRKYKLPLVTQVQGQLVNLPEGTFSKFKTAFIEKTTLMVCKYSDCVRAISHDIYESLSAKGIESRKITVVPSRCDVQKFNPEIYENEREKIRNELGISRNEIVVIFTGRVVKYRDLESDIEAVNILRNNEINIRFVIVGDGDNLINIKSMVHALKLEDRILFTGRVNFDDMPKYLSVGDIFLSTPTNEAIARGVLEAMAMRLPVIASNVGGNREVITHGENGLLVPVGNPIEIAKAIETICKDKKLIKQMGEKARNIVEENFEYSKMIRRFAEVHYL